MPAIQYNSTVSFMRLVYQGGQLSHPNKQRKEVAEDQCSDLVNLMNELTGKPTENQFIELIYEAFSVTEEMMQNMKCRKTELVKARQLHIYVRKFFYGMSYPVAGRIYGKDHATAMHAIGVVHNYMDTDFSYRLDTQKIWKLWQSAGVPFPEEFNENWLIFK